MEERLKRLEERVVQLEEEKAGALVAHLANSGERLAGVRRVALAAVRLGLSSARISAMMPTDYYDRPLEARQGLVGATSRHHLCKSILLENMAYCASDADDELYPRFLVAIIQYTHRLHALKVNTTVRQLKLLQRKKYDYRVADEKESEVLTGFMHNSMAPIGMATLLPTIVDSSILELKPSFVWLGGGHVQVKLGCKASEMAQSLPRCMVADITS